MRSPQEIAARIAAVYATVSTAWILGSGYLGIRLPQPLEGMFEIGKGLLFVLVTSTCSTSSSCAGPKSPPTRRSMSPT